MFTNTISNGSDPSDDWQQGYGFQLWCCRHGVYRGDEEVRQIPDPPPQVANRFPVPVRTRTAPVIDRLQPVSDKLR